MVLTILVVGPCDHVADWELWVTASVQHHESVVLHITSPGKDQIQNSNYTFY